MAAPNFRPSGSCAQFSCILYGLGPALGSAGPVVLYGTCNMLISPHFASVWPPSALRVKPLTRLPRQRAGGSRNHHCRPKCMAHSRPPLSISPRIASKHSHRGDPPLCARPTRAAAKAPLLDHLVGEGDRRRRDGDTKSFLGMLFIASARYRIKFAHTAKYKTKPHAIAINTNQIAIFPNLGTSL